MRPNKLFAAAAALALLVSGPAAAQSAQALSLAGSPSVARAGASIDGSSELGGRRGGIGWILAIVAIGILVFVVVQSQDDNDLPNSP